MFLEKMKAVIATVVLLAVGGCTSSSTTQSSKSPQYTATLTKLFVITNMGNGLRTTFGDETDDFIALSKSSLDSCGIKSEFHTRDDKLALKDTLSQQIAQFGPDAVLELSWTKDVSGRATHVVNYTANLYDPKSRSVVWTATITLNQHYKAGAEMASALIGQMKKDAVLGASCQTPKAS
ncbi:hypothetical protein [Nitrospirillum sp. BR 11828]|uniref:hypothetical protein n=1 Tax=Nitrospirillum sp. BR 11828 TaxID=3104325 RepID=UPI002ACAAB7D|nr:hypothetical protein [Nitrospirillum sp. BR 11828]MDZ5646561.1 hypothetical protein [Nitrospirillum sp. BR 11828]